MKTIYMYPMWDKRELHDEHPYISALCLALTSDFDVVNYEKKPKLGILDIFLYLFKADVFYLNWIEDLALRKLGTLQSLAFVVFALLAKLFGKKIVWTHHNKSSHLSENQTNKYLVNFLLKTADYIVAHSKDSFAILHQKELKHKILYFFHPFFSTSEKRTLVSDVPPKYDILIWGNMRKSKGVHHFLQYLKETSQLEAYRLKIIGKFESAAFYEDVKKQYDSPTIEMDNRFIGEDELESLHASARFIFFPYTGKSVLNSGVLIRSLTFGIPIIGPNVGGFKDLKEAGLIQVYNSFDDIPALMNQSADGSLQQKISAFCAAHSWRNFVLFLKNYL